MDNPHYKQERPACGFTPLKITVVSRDILQHDAEYLALSEAKKREVLKSYAFFACSYVLVSAFIKMNKGRKHA